jgi:Arc/MetJ-type ribon-helix-helix transcriptional regulator
MNENQSDTQGNLKDTNQQLTPQTAASRAGETLDEITSTLRDLFNRVPETVNKAVERAMNVRDTTVLIRLSESSSDSIDTLVSAGIFKGRSDAAAFLIDEGIKAQAALFQGIQDKLGEIEKLREELRHSVTK